MHKIMRLLSAAALLVLNNSTAGAQQREKMGAISTSEAVEIFRDICVRHYLDRSGLLEELRAGSVTWTFHSKRRPSDVSGGLYFESTKGEIGYVSSPNLPATINDPACHFTFISGKGSAHRSLVSLAIKEFALTGGRDTTSKISKQMRWDYQDFDRVLARIFVTSDLKANGRTVSRLSISRHRTPQPEPAGQTS